MGREEPKEACRKREYIKTHTYDDFCQNVQSTMHRNEEESNPVIPMTEKSMIEDTEVEYLEYI